MAYMQVSGPVTVTVSLLIVSRVYRTFVLIPADAAKLVFSIALKKLTFVGITLAISIIKVTCALKKRKEVMNTDFYF